MTFSGAVALLVCVAASLPAQVVEQFTLASGEPRFGEQSWIGEEFALWLREGPSRSEDTIQAKRLTPLDGPVIDIAQIPGSRVGFFLSKDHVFWGVSEVFARSLDRLDQGLDGEDVPVTSTPSANVAAVTDEHVFFNVGSSRYFARSVEDFGPDPLEATEFVAEIREVRDSARMEAASDRYFVWQDKDMKLAEETWKVYAKRTEDLFTPGAERLAVDTRMDFFTANLALWGSLLVYQRARTVNERGANGPCDLYMIDLETDAEPQLVFETAGPGLGARWPSISQHYVAWTDTGILSEQVPYARRLVAGRLEGDAFPIGPIGSGSWLALDRNLVIWNGLVPFLDLDEGPPIIIGVELALPGAEDVGDVNQDGTINLTDAVVILRYLFGDGWRPRLRLADADRSGAIELTDAVVILRYLFQGEARPGA